jgi:uncharacterized protein (TIGR03083 family)
MTDTPNPRRSLERLESEQRRLCQRLVELTPAQLELPSNLPGWRVVDLAVHITRVCDSILLAVQRATVGDQSPAFGAAAKPREDAIRAMDAAGWVTLQQTAYQDLTRLVGNLTEEQLEQLAFPHPQGQRSVRWFCTQLLAEVAFHRWDLETSLGGDGPLDDELAAYLLQFLLDPAEPLVGLRRAPNGTATFAVVSNAMGWVLTATERGTAVEKSIAAPAQIPQIQAPPGWLALAVYGRVRVDASAFTITGPLDTPDRFAAVFGPASA